MTGVDLKYICNDAKKYEISVLMEKIDVLVVTTCTTTWRWWIQKRITSPRTGEVHMKSVLAS
jgi:hypothetical protein